MFPRNAPPPPQPSGWDAFKLLKIPPSQPRTPRKCASFNQKGEPCGVGRPPDQKKKADDILDALSLVELARVQDNNEMLYSLAETMLCHHHNSQGHVNSLVGRWQKTISDECRRQRPRGQQPRPHPQQFSRKRPSSTSDETETEDSDTSSPKRRHKHQASVAQSSSSDESETLDHEHEEQVAGSGSTAVVNHQRREALGIRNAELEKANAALTRALKKATKQHNVARSNLDAVTRERDTFSEQVEEQVEEINGLKAQLERARGEDRESDGPESSNFARSERTKSSSPRSSVPSKSASARAGSEDVLGARDRGGLGGMGIRGGTGQRTWLEKAWAYLVFVGQACCVLCLLMFMLGWSAPSFYPATQEVSEELRCK